ncbi:HD domain protein [Thermosipho africanus H17ap60334]|uniref:HD domain-containing phosphohydrolase n=1 Tax=Thermosipho africanus TaxID=2421 RepID=UPI00028E4BC6|nr:HD domain-containing phosphohydrolase [Thermosipho africanus]EKF49786.1 HD domain protein [Thermosipho africanus H17ap60334]
MNKIMIIDDDEFVHKYIDEVLSKECEYEIETIHAFSEKQASKLIEKFKDDISVFFIDVFMENDNSGLVLVDLIRNHLSLRKPRIILATSYKEFVEKKHDISDFDISFFMDKQYMDEFMVKHTFLIAIKSYIEIVTLENTIKSLQKIIELSRNKEKFDNILKFLKFMLYEAINLLRFSSNIGIEGFVTLNGIVYAATPKFEEYLNVPLSKVNFTFFPESTIYFEKELAKDLSIKVYIISNIKLKEINKHLVSLFLEEITNSYSSNYYSNLYSQTQKELLAKLLSAIEARSGETGEHVTRVGKIAKILASKINYSQIDEIEIAASIHDLGKIAIPDSILNKPGKLDDEEYAIIKEHPIIGYNILENSTSKILKLAAVICLQHHENWDGSGYPYGLEKEQIDISARITSIADVFDALVSDRIYRKALPLNKALEIIKKERGKKIRPKSC